VGGHDERVSRDNGDSEPTMLGVRWGFLGSSLVEGLLLPFPDNWTFSFLSLDDLFSVALISLAPPESPEWPFLVVMDENVGIVGAGELVHNGLDSFLAFFLC